MTPPVGQPLLLRHEVLPGAGRLWGAGRPAYPDEPPPAGAVEAGVRGWRESGVGVVVSLIEDWELPRRAPGLYEALDRHGVGLCRFPIADYGAPADPLAFTRLLGDLHRRLREGDGVLVHCNAGLGRTAVVLASLLKICGLGGDAVQEIRRAYRPNAMETAAQEAFVRGFATAPDGGGRHEP